MARIRKVEIKNFRCVKEFSWIPGAGINCLVGPGDSGKSSILDAMDLCLGARRNIQITDADFCDLDVTVPISILLTIGELDDALKSMEAYGMFLRGFDAATGTIEDEPDSNAETVLTLSLTVASDLEPLWTLVSDRAAAENLTRNLTWHDRIRVAPNRIGALADYHLSWRRGSVLNRLSDERADTSAALAKAARHARAIFGDEADQQLGETLRIVAETGRYLGIPIGENVKAMLDAHSVSFSGGMISLHDGQGIPLRGLGIGSIRLLIAGLQQKAAEQSSIVLVDELEYGLEPHRIIRLLGSLGAKEKTPPLQAFVTTHSPVALRELSGSQVFVVREIDNRHEARCVGTAADIQSTVRLFPDAFLAPFVIVCEGASEVGFVRGVDQYRSSNGHSAISALGVALVDAGGGEADRPIRRAAAFCELGYRVAVLRDDDSRPTEAIETAFKKAGGQVFAWRHARTLEDELFSSLTDAAVDKLIDRAVDLHGEELINAHIGSVSNNAKNLVDIQMELLIDGFSIDSRVILGKASRTKKAGWFKSVTWMEDVARDIVGPDLARADEGFRTIVEGIFGWPKDAGG